MDTDLYPTHSDPITLVVSNHYSVSVRPARAAETLHRALDLMPDVLFGSEGADFRARDVIDQWEDDDRALAGTVRHRYHRTRYTAYQPGALGSPESGVFMVTRTPDVELHRRKPVVGSAATSEGDGIRKRLILRAALDLPLRRTGINVEDTPRGRRRAAAAHPAPPRAPIARQLYMSRLVAVRAEFKGGDMNMAARAVQRALGRRVVGHGVLWITVPRRAHIVSVTTHQIGSDHLAVKVVIRLRLTKRERRAYALAA